MGDETNATTTEAKVKRRAQRRRNFGTVISTGTTTEPRFAIRWFEGSKRCQRGGFTTKRDAQLALADVQTKAAAGILDVARRSESPLSEVAGSWLDLHSKQLSAHQHNVERWTKHCKPRLAHLPVGKVTAERLLEFRAALLAEGKLSRSTVNRVLALLRSILRFAAVHGYIAASPTDRMARGTYMLAVERKKISPPIERPEDVGALLEKIRELYPTRYALFATAVYCGLRKGELAGLHWADIHTDERYILVRRSYATTTKSKRWRTVPMPDELAPILAAHRLACPFKGDLAFPDAEGGMITKDTRLQSQLAEAIKQAKVAYRPVVPGWTRLHDLRHEYGSMYIARGGNISDLQKNLGHSSVAVTEIYAHAADEHRIREAQRMSFKAPDGKVVAMHSAK